MSAGKNIYDIEVNTNLSIMKPIHAKWVNGLYDSLRNDPELVKSGFSEAGIRPWLGTFRRKLYSYVVMFACFSFFMKGISMSEIDHWFTFLSEILSEIRPKS